MAKQGKKISVRSRAAIQVKYETGLLTLKQIAKQHHTTEKTIIGLANKEGWERGKVSGKVNKKLVRRAEKKLIEKEGDKLFDYTSEYIDNIKNLDKAHKANLGAYIQALRETKNNISKAEADKFKTSQQFLKLSAETFKINFEGVRLAMGLDKKESSVNVQVNNIQELDNLSDEELDRIIYGE